MLSNTRENEMNFHSHFVFIQGCDISAMVRAAAAMLAQLITPPGEASLATTGVRAKPASSKEGLDDPTTGYSIGHLRSWSASDKIVVRVGPAVVEGGSCGGEPWKSNEDCSASACWG